MRWIVAALALLCTGVARGEDQVWYVKCRIWNAVPRIGPLHHACVVICDERECPYCLDAYGHKVGNPTLTYYGSRPKQPGFSAEEPPVVEITAVKANVPASVVKQRLQEYDGRWTLIKNCQTAAKWAVQPESKLWAIVMQRK